VQFRQNRGAVVSGLTMSEIEEIYMMRRALEDLALTHALPHITPADLAEMDHILNQIELETDLSRWVERNWEFHAALYRPAGLPLLQKTIRELHNNVARFVAAHHLSDAQLASSQQQHRDLLDAVRKQDLTQARKLLQHHLTHPIDLFKDTFNRK